MGDRVAIMNGGELQQVASPLELYSKPVNLFVAGFIGSPPMNLLKAEPTATGVRLGNYEVSVESTVRTRLPQEVTLGVRPEALSLVGEHDGGFAVDAVVVEHIGSDAYVQGSVDLGNGVASNVIVRTPGRMHVSKGDRIHVAIDPADIHLFDTVTGVSLAG
jgi:multiple sugar transport system ATP-binding protein